MNSGGGGTPSPFPSGGIGVGIPTGKIGVESDPVWGTVSGYTQEQTSQIMAFPPGVTVTIIKSVDNDAAYAQRHRRTAARRRRTGPKIPAFRSPKRKRRPRRRTMPAARSIPAAALKSS